MFPGFRLRGKHKGSEYVLVLGRFPGSISNSSLGVVYWCFSGAILRLYDFL